MVNIDVEISFYVFGTVNYYPLDDIRNCIGSPKLIMRKNDVELPMYPRDNDTLIVNGCEMRHGRVYLDEHEKNPLYIFKKPGTAEHLQEEKRRLSGLGWFIVEY